MAATHGADLKMKGKQGRELNAEITGGPRFESLETRDTVEFRYLDRLPAGSLPPDLRIVGTVENLGQFLLDLAQADGSKLESGLIKRIVSALFRKAGIQVAQIGDFLTKAGETFGDIWHLFHHTP